MIGDTIVLNPQLEKRTFVESEVLEQENPADTGLTLYLQPYQPMDRPGGNVVRTDTVQIWRLDSQPSMKGRKRTREEYHPTGQYAALLPATSLKRS